MPAAWLPEVADGPMWLAALAAVRDQLPAMAVLGPDPKCTRDSGRLGFLAFSSEVELLLKLGYSSIAYCSTLQSFLMYVVCELVCGLSWPPDGRPQSQVLGPVLRTSDVPDSSRRMPSAHLVIWISRWPYPLDSFMWPRRYKIECPV